MNPSRLAVVLVFALAASSLARGADREFEAALEKRMLRLQRIQAAHAELAAERDKLNSQLQTVKMQLVQAQTQIAAGNQQAAVQTANLLQLQNDHAALTAQAATLAQSRVPVGGQLQILENQIQGTRTRINFTNATIGQLNTAVAQANQRAAALETQAVGGQRSLQAVLKKLDKQENDYLDQADPFGRLTRAEHEAALVSLNEWLKADATNNGARIARAFAYRKLGKLDNSLADLTTVVDAAGSLVPVALAARGELAVARGNERDGLADLAQAYKLDKKDPRIFVFRGLAHWRSGKFQAAETDFKGAIRADKDDVEAVRHLALLNAASDMPGVRDGRKAIELGERAIELAKYADWSCFDALAAAHAEAGNFDEASRTAREAAELTFGENRELCLERARLFGERTPLRIKWK